MAPTSQPCMCEWCRAARTETGMNSALTSAKRWAPPCQNSTCVLWLLWESFCLLSDPSTKQNTLPYIYVGKGRNTTYLLFLCTHRNHFTSKPGLLNKRTKTSESQAKMLKNLCSQISLGSRCEWSPSPWICGDNSLTSSFTLFSSAASHIFQLSELLAQSLQTQNPNSTTKSKYLFLKQKLHSLPPEQTSPFAILVIFCSHIYICVVRSQKAFKRWQSNRTQFILLHEHNARPDVENWKMPFDISLLCSMCSLLSAK